MDVEIEEEDKVMILLNSLLDEQYKTFVLILINGEKILNYSNVSAALINYKIRKKNKQSSSYDTTARGMGPNHKKDMGEFGKFKTGGHEELKKNQYTFCRERH